MFNCDYPGRGLICWRDDPTLLGRIMGKDICGKLENSYERPSRIYTAAVQSELGFLGSNFTLLVKVHYHAMFVVTLHFSVTCYY